MILMDAATRSAFADGYEDAQMNLSPQYIYCSVSITGTKEGNATSAAKSVSGRGSVFFVAENGDVLVHYIDIIRRNETASKKWGEEDKARKEAAEAAAQKATLKEAEEKAQRERRKKEQQPIWEARCRRHEDARQSCATAANLAACMRIRLSPEDFVMGGTYCRGDKPNYNMMGLE